MRGRILALGLTVLAAGLVLDVADALARAQSGGSRGSRSYSAPARPSGVSPGMPSSPARQYAQPAPSPMSPQRPGMFGGLMGGLAGFALGGLLGGMLFGGLGGGFGSGMMGGVGLMDIMLLAGGALLLFAFLRRRRAAAPAPAPAWAPAGGVPPQAAYGYGDAAGSASGGVATLEAPPVAETDLARGLGHIRSMDPAFDPAGLAGVAGDVFAAVQRALASGSLVGVRDRVTEELYASLERQSAETSGAGRQAHVEAISVRRAELTEAWQEGGRDFATVYLVGALKDWTTDARSGAVVDGSPSAAVEFEEFWTFTRPVGPGSWRLTSIARA